MLPGQRRRSATVACGSAASQKQSSMVATAKGGRPIGTMSKPIGAGHEAQQMSAICQAAMVFKRSAGGRSHTPEKFSSVSDCANGIRLVAEALRRPAY